MKNPSGNLPDYIHRLRRLSPFMEKAEIKVVSICSNGAVLSMYVDPAVHFSHRGSCHDAVLSSFAVTALEMTGAGVGKDVSVMDFSITMNHPMTKAGYIEASTRIRHNGKTTMVIEAEIRSRDDHSLLAAVLATMLVHPAR